MVARVLLLMRAGLRALLSPPGVRLRRAPLNTHRRSSRSITALYNRQNSTIHLNVAYTNPEANWGDVIKLELSPAAAAATAAKLGLVDSWAAPCSAAERLGAATITWPVPKLVATDVGACETIACRLALLSVDVDWKVVVDGLTEGELLDVAFTGAVEMTEAVFVPPTVVPGLGKGNTRNSTGSLSPSD